nr:hypothetical protein [Bacteroidota bacterium]
MKKSIFLFAFLLNAILSLGQSNDDEYYSKLNALDLYYIPDNIRRNIVLGRGYDLTDPWAPVIADESPFLTKSQRPAEVALRSTIPSSAVPIGTGSSEFKYSFEENVNERTVAQYFHADLKVRGLSYNIETSAEYVRTQFNMSQAVRFVLENKSTLPNDIDINATFKTAPVTERSDLDENSKWKLFKAKYGSHYVTSFSYGYRIEVIAFANTSIESSKFTLSAAFKAWSVSGKFDASISEQIKQSGATIFVTVFCQELKNTQTNSTLPFVFRGIPDVLNFLDDLKGGKIIVTPAPTSVSFKSYFASVCSSYPNSCKLFSTKFNAVDTNAVPRGTILAWNPPVQNVRTINGQTIIVPPVGGWSICDDRTHQLNPRVPDLSDRFLYGTSDPTQIDKTRWKFNSWTSDNYGTARGNSRC